MDEYQVVEIDKRFLGHRWFRYAICASPGTFAIKEYVLFNKYRDWCITTMGPSTEIEGYPIATVLDPTVASGWYPNLMWSWKTETPRIYLKSDTELTMFTMRWK